MSEPTTVNSDAPSVAAEDSRPMVLHVRVVTRAGGGPEKTILNSPRFLAKLGYQSKLAYLHPPGDPGFETILRRGRDVGAEVLSLPDSGPFDVSLLRRLYRVCRDNRVDIWHGHDYKSNVFGLLLRPWWRMKLVTTLHGWVDTTGRNNLYRKIDHWAIKYYESLICVSDDLVQACRDLRIPPERTHLIYNAIDTDEYQRQFSTADAKERCQVPSDTFLIGAVGRLSPEKGFDLLIRAVTQLRRAGKNVTLHIAGEGIARGDLESLIAELGCGEYVKLLGHVSNPKLFYQAMDLYVLSSISEGLPNVVLEAMALETPVLATSVAGVPKLIEADVSGMLIEPGQVDALVAGLEKVIDQPQLREAYRIAARQRIEERFRFDMRMRKVTHVYDELLKNHKCHRAK